MENAGFEMDEKAAKRGDSMGNNSKRRRNSDSRGRNSTKSQHDSVAVESSGGKRPPDEDLEPDGTPNIFGRIVLGIRSAVFQALSSNRKRANQATGIVAALLYHAYLAYAIYYAVEELDHIDWCDGVGILIVLTALTYWSLFYYFILKRHFGKGIRRGIWEPLQNLLAPIRGKWYVSYGWSFLVLAATITFVAVDARDEPRRLVSAAGVLAVLLVCLLVSKHPGRVKWNQVFWGIMLEFIFGVVVLRWNGGRLVFDCISEKVSTFLAFSLAGSDFVYSYLSAGVNVTLSDGDNISMSPIFAFQALSVIFFFCFFINILYYYGIMMWVISKLGWLLSITVGTTAAESMNAAANIFIGQTEAPILIKPFLQDMTNSELHAVMTGGFATIAGGIMAAYISFGINTTHLLSSSIMAAPAALAVSKLIYPETKVSRTTADQIKHIKLSQEGNVLDAAAAGATQGVQIVGNIIANIIAFMSFIAFLNALIGWFGGLVGVDELSFEWILSKVMIPFAYAIGIESDDVEDVALLLGLKTAVNEFVAYQRMIGMHTLSERSRAIATFALCSFANFGSIGIQLGGLGYMAPNRRSDISKTIWYAFVAGSLTSLLNASIAGTLLTFPKD